MSIGITATGGSVVLRLVAPGEVDADADREEEERQRRRAVGVPGRRTIQRQIDVDAVARPTPKTFTEKEVEMSTREMEWRELDQRIEARRPPTDERARNRRNNSECEPNCTVLVVTAK